MNNDVLKIIHERNEFYRKNYRVAVSSLVLAIAIIAALSSILYYQLTHPPAPVYFATTSDGRIMTLIPVSESNVTDDQLLQWATNSAIAAYTYSFKDYRQQLQAASDFFTPDGWRAFLTALKDSNNLEAVKLKKLVVSAALSGKATIVKQANVNGTYYWRVHIPILVTFQNASDSSSTQSLIISMLISRVSTLGNDSGLGIAQLVAFPQEDEANSTQYENSSSAPM